MLTELEQSADREARHALHDLVTELEAKLAKAVEGLNIISAWGEDTYARDIARATLAEIEGEKG